MTNTIVMSLFGKYLFEGPYKDLDHFTTSLKAPAEAANGLCFIAFDKRIPRPSSSSSSQSKTTHDYQKYLPVGIVNLMNNFPEHLKVEIGGIFYSPLLVQRTGVNLEATTLLLEYVFEKLRYRRVEWKCNNLNERSKKAALKMGFKFEGIQEAHFIIKNCNRDSAWFRILASEWKDLKPQLAQKLADKL